MSSSHERKARAYLSPKNNSLLIGYVTIEQLSKSETINIALKAFFQGMSEEKRKRYIAKAAEVEAQKKVKTK